MWQQKDGKEQKDKKQQRKQQRKNKNNGGGTSETLKFGPRNYLELKRQKVKGRENKKTLNAIMKLKSQTYDKTDYEKNRLQRRIKRNM